MTKAVGHERLRKSQTDEKEGLIDNAEFLDQQEPWRKEYLMYRWMDRHTLTADAVRKHSWRAGEVVMILPNGQGQDDCEGIFEDLGCLAAC